MRASSGWLVGRSSTQARARSPSGSSTSSRPTTRMMFGTIPLALGEKKWVTARVSGPKESPAHMRKSTLNEPKTGESVANSRVSAEPDAVETVVVTMAPSRTATTL